MAGPPPEGGVPPPLPGHRVRPEREQPTPDPRPLGGRRRQVGLGSAGPRGPDPPLGVPAAASVIRYRVHNVFLRWKDRGATLSCKLGLTFEASVEVTRLLNAG